MRKCIPLLTVLLLTAMSSQAWAQNSTEPPANRIGLFSAGDPNYPDMPTLTEGFPDIYARQIAYRKEAMALRDAILARQEDFNAPARQARAAHKSAMESLNASRSADTHY